MTGTCICQKLPELHIDFVVDRDFHQPPDKYKKQVSPGGYQVVFRCSCRSTLRFMSGVFQSYADADRRCCELAAVDLFAPYPSAAEPRIAQVVYRSSRVSE